MTFMFKKNTTKEWIQLGLACLVVLYMGYFFSLRLNDHIVSATQGSVKFPSRLYLKHFIYMDAETRVGDRTPIQYAIMNYGELNDKKIKNLKPVVNMFQKKGVDIDAVSTYGLSSLHYAIMAEDDAAVAFLIQEGANVNQGVRVDSLDQMIKPAQIDGMTPLRFLEERRKENLIKNAEKIAKIENLLKAAGAQSGTSPRIDGKSFDQPQSKPEAKKSAPAKKKTKLKK